MATIQDLANYVMQMEGYNVPNSLAQRNNNPGNLRASSLATGSNRGYAVFPDAQTGYEALLRQIQLDQNRGLTLRDFIYKYAPPTENNSAAYLSFITNGIGVDPNASLATLGSSLDGSTGSLGTEETINTPNFFTSLFGNMTTGLTNLFAPSPSYSLDSYSGGFVEDSSSGMFSGLTLTAIVIAGIGLIYVLRK